MTEHPIVEKVARVLCHLDDIEPDGIEIDGPNWTHYIDDAKSIALATIDALMEAESAWAGRAVRIEFEQCNKAVSAAQCGRTFITMLAQAKKEISDA